MRTKCIDNNSKLNFNINSLLSFTSKIEKLKYPVCYSVYDKLFRHYTLVKVPHLLLEKPNHYTVNIMHWVLIFISIFYNTFLSSSTLLLFTNSFFWINGFRVMIVRASILYLLRIWFFFLSQVNRYTLCARSSNKI